VSVGDEYSNQTQVATITPAQPTVTQESTILYLMNGLTLAMPGTYYDTNPADYTVTFGNGAVGTVTAVTSSSLTVSFTTLPTALGPMSATVTVAGTYGSTSATQSQVAIIMPNLQTSTITCNPTTVGISDATGTSGEVNITVSLTPYDQNGNVITSGASSITSYATFNTTLSITTSGSIGTENTVTYDSGTGAYTMVFAPDYAAYNSYSDKNAFNIDFYGFFAGQQISTYCWSTFDYDEAY